MLDWIEVKELARSSAEGNICIEKTADDRIIYQNGQSSHSIAFVSFTYKKGKKQNIQLRITSRARAPLLLTIRKGQTVITAVAGLLQVEAASLRTDIYGVYKISLHSIDKKRIVGGCGGECAFEEMKLLEETVRFCAVNGMLFRNDTGKLFYTIISATNKSREPAKVLLNGMEEVKIEPYCTRSMTVPGIVSIEAPKAQQVEVSIVVHMLI